ncbi:MAG: orotidine-5'-phosphate decarboxylase [Syntrophales bacterium]|nr:orotidine-5'-phosphate decarboxylase [Syntrophales bacterium]
MKTKSSNPARDRLIFALDTGESLEEALGWVSLLRDHVGMFKIGKEIFTRFGPAIVEEIASRGGRIFLDLKFHDIPNTVARAVEAAMRMPVAMLNIHALGGSAMMKEAVKASIDLSKEKGVRPPIILAVTVLTSLDNEDVKTLGFSSGTKSLVKRLAVMARDSGVSGVVASPLDVAPLRKICGEDFLIVTPGIRLTRESSVDDQKRTLTPREAIAAGADYIVVGRPIRTAVDPVKTSEYITEEINRGKRIPRHKDLE